MLITYIFCVREGTKDMLLIIVIFVCSFAIFDAIRRLNNNIIEQTEEIKKLREETNSFMKKSKMN